MPAYTVRAGSLATPVDCGAGGATVTNQGPSTVYYRDEFPCDASTNDGSIASGSSATLTGTQYFFVSSASAQLSVALTAATSSGTGAGTILAWATAARYVQGQAVTNGGATYTAVDTHTAGATFVGDAAHWTLLPAGAVATASVLGAVKVTGTPADAANPLAIGDTDTRVAGTTKRVTLPIGADNTTTASGFSDVLQRWKLTLPVTTTRWRLKIRNPSPGTAGAITLNDIYVGTPDESSGTSWLGAFTGAGTVALSGLSMTADNTEYTTAWVTDPTLQWAPDTVKGLSVGFTCSAALTLSKGLGRTVALRYGAGSAAQVGAQTPSGGSIVGGNQFLDIRFEYEFVGNNPVVLVIGDSISAGYMDVLLENVLSPNNVWPAIVGLRDRACWINLSVSGASYSSFASGSSHYNRIDLATTVPDIAILACGVNDANGSTALATFQTNVLNARNALKAYGIKRFQMLTPFPQPRWRPGVVMAQAASGVSSLSTDIAYVAGDVVTVDYGLATQETLTVLAGGSTGVASPFTTPFTGNTTQAHGYGSTINLQTTEDRRIDYLLWMRRGVPGFEQIIDVGRALCKPQAPYAGDVGYYGAGNQTHPGPAAHQAVADLVRIR